MRLLITTSTENFLAGFSQWKQTSLVSQENRKKILNWSESNYASCRPWVDFQAANCTRTLSMQVRVSPRHGESMRWHTAKLQAAQFTALPLIMSWRYFCHPWGARIFFDVVLVIRAQWVMALHTFVVKNSLSSTELLSKKFWHCNNYDGGDCIRQ